MLKALRLHSKASGALPPEWQAGGAGIVHPMRQKPALRPGTVIHVALGQPSKCVMDFALDFDAFLQ